MMLVVALMASVLAGTWFPRLIHTGHRLVAAGFVGALTVAASTEEWAVIVVGAAIGAAVGIAVDTKMAPRQRLLSFFASIGTGFVLTIPLVNQWTGETVNHAQSTLLLTAAGVALMAPAILSAIRTMDWPGLLREIIRSWLERRTSSDDGKRAYDDDKRA